MRDHPLTPMHDPDLCRVLARQCRGPVGLVPFGTVAAGAEAIAREFAALRERGVRIAVVDALTDDHLGAIGRACATLRADHGRGRGGVGPARQLPAGRSARGERRAGAIAIAGGARAPAGRQLFDGNAGAGGHVRFGASLPFAWIPSPSPTASQSLAGHLRGPAGGSRARRCPRVRHRDGRRSRRSAGPARRSPTPPRSSKARSRPSPARWSRAACAPWSWRAATPRARWPPPSVFGAPHRPGDRARRAVDRARGCTRTGGGVQVGQFRPARVLPRRPSGC